MRHECHACCFAECCDIWPPSGGPFALNAGGDLSVWGYVASAGASGDGVAAAHGYVQVAFLPSLPIPSRFIKMFKGG